MGVPKLLSGILPQFLKSHNVQSFCETWHRTHNQPCRIGIDASAVIHPMLRKHKDTLLLDGSKIDQCPHFRKSLLTCILDMTKWASGNVVLHLVCDGRRIIQKLQNAERARVRETAREQLADANLADDNEMDSSATDRLKALAVGSFGPAAALVLISVCKELGISCEIALFESEHQLAALQRQKIIDIILANDSDFIRLGCWHVFFPGITMKKFNYLWFHNCRYWPGTSILDVYAGPFSTWTSSAKTDITTMLLSSKLKDKSYMKLLCITICVMGFNMIPLLAVLLGNDYVDHKESFPTIGISKAIQIVYNCAMQTYPLVDFNLLLESSSAEQMKSLLPSSSFVDITVKQMSLIFGHAVSAVMKKKTPHIYIDAYENALIAFDLSTVCSSTNAAVPLGCYPFPSNMYQLKLELTENGYNYPTLLNQVTQDNFNVAAVETKTCLNLFGLQSININEWKQGYYDIQTFTVIPHTRSENMLIEDAAPQKNSAPMTPPVVDCIPDDDVLRRSNGGFLTNFLKSLGLTHSGSVAELRIKALAAVKIARAYGLTKESQVPTKEEQRELHKIVNQGYMRLNDPMEQFLICTDLSPTLNEDVIDTYMLMTSSATSSTSIGSRVNDNGSTRSAELLRPSKELWQKTIYLPSCTTKAWRKQRTLIKQIFGLVHLLKPLLTKNFLPKNPAT